MSKDIKTLQFQPVLYQETAAPRRILKLKELPVEMQPSSRLTLHGTPALSTAELIAIIIGTGSKTMNAIEVAEQLLIEFNDIVGIARATVEELCAVPGITETKAHQLKAAFELGRRQLSAGALDRLQIRTPVDLANLLMLEMSLLESEQLRVAILDTKNILVKTVTVYSGSLNSAVVRVGEVFKEAIRCNAASIIITHNHPSGDPTPSPEDVRMTEMVVEAGKLLDIDVLDHIIIGRNRFVSLSERGLGFK